MYYYVINPAAGRGAINNIQDKLRARLQELGIAGEFAKTTGSGDATKMAQAAIAKGYNTIVAVGGDGTVNEVMNGITKDNVALGIVPIGNSNQIADRLGIHNWQQAAAVLAARRITSFGLIAAGQKYFLTTLTLGFETDLDKQVDTTESGVRSRLKQIGHGAGLARNYDLLKASIEVDGSYTLDCELFSLSVANQKFENQLADNRLIVSIADRPAARQLGGYLWRKLRGQQPLDEGATTRFRASRLLISTEPSTGIMIDGKVAGRTPIAIRLTDKHIRFITEKPPTALGEAAGTPPRSSKLDL